MGIRCKTETKRHEKREEERWEGIEGRKNTGKDGKMYGNIKVRKEGRR